MVISGVVISGVVISDIVISGVVIRGFGVACGVLPLTVDPSLVKVDVDIIGVKLTKFWSVVINVEPRFESVVVVDVVVFVVVVVVRFDVAGLVLHRFSRKHLRIHGGPFLNHSCLLIFGNRHVCQQSAYFSAQAHSISVLTLKICF